MRNLNFKTVGSGISSVALAKRKRAWVFGSSAKKADGLDSDIDILAEARPSFSLFGLSGFRLAPEGRLRRRVDIVFRKHLHPALSPEIQSPKQLVYGARDYPTSGDVPHVAKESKALYKASKLKGRKARK